MDPARIFTESLTPRPELENSQDPNRTWLQLHFPPLEPAVPQAVAAIKTYAAPLTNRPLLGRAIVESWPRRQSLRLDACRFHRRSCYGAIRQEEAGEHVRRIDKAAVDNLTVSDVHDRRPRTAWQ